MYRGLALVILTQAAWAQPVITAVVSAADGSVGDLAPGGLATIYGTNLASSAEAGVTVAVRSDGRDLPARLLYVAPGQINFQTPPDTAPGSASVLVTSAGQTGSEPVTVASARFTAFTATQVPFGPAVAQQVRGSAIERNRLGSAAVAGDVLVLWGTGLGGRERDDVRVWLGGVEVAPAYAGPAPGLIGVDQINITVPVVSENCFLPLTVDVGGRASAAYTVATAASPGPCRRLYTFQGSALDALDAGGTVRIHGMTIEETAAEHWTGVYDAAHLAVLANHDFSYRTGPVTCRTDSYSFSRFEQPVPRLLPREVYGAIQTAGGASVSLGGPCPISLARGVDGISRASFTAECAPRSYAVAGSGWSMSGTILPTQLPPFPTASLDLSRREVSWNGNAAPRFTLEQRASFTLPGNIFSGLTTVTEASCLLLGPNGSARIDSPPAVWESPQTSARFRQSTANVSAGSGPPLEAAVVRVVRTEERDAVR